MSVDGSKFMKILYYLEEKKVIRREGGDGGTQRIIAVYRVLYARFRIANS